MLEAEAAEYAGLAETRSAFAILASCKRNVPLNKDLSIFNLSARSQKEHVSRVNCWMIAQCVLFVVSVLSRIVLYAFESCRGVSACVCVFVWKV